MRILPRLAALLLCAAPTVAAQQPSLQEGGGVQMMVFGDALFLTTDRSVPAGFVLGQLVGHLNAPLTSRLAFFTEVSATGRAAGYSVEVERAFLRYDLSDALKLSLGRYHTPVGYWNTAFHHGAWLQTSVARPEMVKFGSRFLPVHFVGVLAEGTVPRAPLGLGYTLGVGNGRGAVISRAGDAGDANGERAWMANLHARPSALMGLQLGGGYYRDRVTPERGEEAEERILTAYLALERESPELVAEYARVLHTRVGERGNVPSSSGFVQVGYRLPGPARAWKPYLRVERLEAGAGDPVFVPAEHAYRAALLGVRYDFAPLAALKAEYRRERFEASRRFHSLYLQASFAVTGAGGSAAHPPL